MIKKYYFRYDVREGPPGFADNDFYQSDNYSNFEMCFRKYLKFNPRKHWNYLRNCSEYFVYIDENNCIHKNRSDDGVIYYSDCEIDLGISEGKFDDIIEKCKGNVINHTNESLVRNKPRYYF
jgi:hypothetical protein